MRLLKSLFVACAALITTQVNAANLIDEFNPATLAGFVGIAINPATGNLVVYQEALGTTFWISTP